MSKQALNIVSTRIDKWLWTARFYKTRSLATEMVAAGHVQINAASVKPSRAVKAGDQLTIRRGDELFEVKVTAIAAKRVSATIAQTLYNETAESQANREKQQEMRKLHAAPAPEKRPDKKARRQIIRFRRKEE